MDTSGVKAEAAKALSNVLFQHGIGHAFIGGFAVRLLGSTRPTEDIDVEIDASAAELRGRITQLLVESDPRFSVEHLKLVFTSANPPGSRVLVERLPIGELGLPRVLKVIWLGECNIPILHPGVLVLTKIKRCATMIGSTRPKTIEKVHCDVSDITHLLEWLAEKGEMVNFVDYASLRPEGLYSAVKALLENWKKSGEVERVQLLDSLLQEGDREKIKMI